MTQTEPPACEPVIRHVSRILVLDPDDRILLFFANAGFSVEPERRPDALGFWALPGGGVDPGEDHAGAAVRELREETGMIAPGPLPWVASRDATYPWRTRWFRSIERYYLYRAPSAAVDASGWLDSDRRWMRDLGWWTLARLAATDDIVRPPGLLALAQRIAAGDVPQEPVELPAA